MWILTWSLLESRNLFPAEWTEDEEEMHAEERKIIEQLQATHKKNTSLTIINWLKGTWWGMEVEVGVGEGGGVNHSSEQSDTPALG